MNIFYIRFAVLLQMKDIYCKIFLLESQEEIIPVTSQKALGTLLEWFFFFNLHVFNQMHLYVAFDCLCTVTPLSYVATLHGFSPSYATVKHMKAVFKVERGRMDMSDYVICNHTNDKCIQKLISRNLFIILYEFSI